MDNSAAPQRRRRRRVEEATVLDLSELRAWGWLTAGVFERYWYPHGIHDPRAGLLRHIVDDAHSELHVFFPSEHVVKLECDTPPFGGRRWWLVCPLTGRRARKLYLFADQRRFRHREAIDPPFSYPSQRTSGLNRALERRDAADRKLKDGALLVSGKPVGMRWKTYFRHVAKARRLEQVVTTAILKRILPPRD